MIDTLFTILVLVYFVLTGLYLHSITEDLYRSGNYDTRFKWVVIWLGYTLGPIVFPCVFVAGMISQIISKVK